MLISTVAQQNSSLDLSGSRSQYVVNSIQKPVKLLLDVGCGYGGTSQMLTQKAESVWGIDMDEQALASASQNFPNVKFIRQTGAELPFEDDMFDAVILSDVIEHVGDENQQLVVDEIWRVLKPGGIFIFTAPHAGLSAWADPLDFKRRFTPIYRIYMKLTGYKPQTAISIGHKHVSLEHVHQLLANRFEITNLRFSGLFMPLILWLCILANKIRVMPQSLISALNSLQAWESGVEYPRLLAYNIRLCASKKL